jgi:hypothetical protein
VDSRASSGPTIRRETAISFVMTRVLMLVLFFPWLATALL